MSAQKLKYLSILLKNLPNTLPAECGNDSDYDTLDPFILDKNHIVQIGDEVQAFCYVLDTIFKANNQWTITERGWCICKVVTVLEWYLEKFPENKVILEWMDGFKMALTTVYHEARCPLSQLVSCYQILHNSNFFSTRSRKKICFLKRLSLRLPS